MLDISLSNFEIGLLVSAALYGVVSLFMRRVKSFWLYSLIVWPGTVAHELLHFIVGLLFRASPVGFSVFPRKEGNTWVFGSVSFESITNVNAFPVAMAPLIALVAPAIALTYFQPELISLPWHEQVVLAILLGIVCYSSIPSGQDWKVAFSRPFGTLVWLLLIAILAGESLKKE